MVKDKLESLFQLFDLPTLLIMVLLYIILGVESQRAADDRAGQVPQCSLSVAKLLLTTT